MVQENIRMPSSGARLLPWAKFGGTCASLRSAYDWNYTFPYAGTTAPRVTAFCGEARKTIVAATSSTFGHASKSALGIELRLAGVSMIDGATAFTRIPSGATSSASATVRAAKPAFDAV